MNAYVSKLNIVECMFVMKLWARQYFWGWSNFTISIPYSFTSMLFDSFLCSFLALSPRFVPSFLFRRLCVDVECSFLFLPLLSPFFLFSPSPRFGCSERYGCRPPRTPARFGAINPINREGKGRGTVLERIYADLLNTKNVIHNKQNLSQKKAFGNFLSSIISIMVRTNSTRSRSWRAAALAAAVDKLPAAGERGDGGRGRGGRGRGGQDNDEGDIRVQGDGDDDGNGGDGHTTKALMNYEKCPCRKNFRRGGAPREPKQLPVVKNERCVLCSSKGKVSLTKVACARLAHPMWHAKMYLCVKPRWKGRL